MGKLFNLFRSLNTPSGTFRIRDSSDGKWYWILQANNGETLCTSEMYNSRQAAKDGIEACIAAVENPKVA